MCRTGDDSATASSQNPSISDMHPARTDNAGMHLIHENTSYSGNAGLVTPAPREGQKFTASLPQLADTSPQHVMASLSLLLLTLRAVSAMPRHMLLYAGTIRCQYTSALLQQDRSAVASSLQISERGGSSALDHGL